MYRKHTFHQIAFLPLFKFQFRLHKFPQLILSMLQCVSIFPAILLLFIFVTVFLYSVVRPLGGSSFSTGWVCCRDSDTFGPVCGVEETWPPGRVCLALRSRACLSARGERRTVQQSFPLRTIMHIVPSVKTPALEREEAWIHPHSLYQTMGLKVGLHPCGGKGSFLNSSKGFV